MMDDCRLAQAAASGHPASLPRIPSNLFCLLPGRQSGGERLTAGREAISAKGTGNHISSSDPIPSFATSPCPASLSI